MAEDKPLNIALVGTGKMGKAIGLIAAPVAAESPYTLVSSFNSGSTLTPDSVSYADAVIDFTNKEAFLKNLPVLLSSGKPLVVGTTGWLSELETVKSQVQAAGGTLLYASNFSLGVNLFFRLVREAARLIDPFEAFDIALTETHHTAKLDAPSGTALTAAAAILSEMTRKRRIRSELTPNQKVQPEDLVVSALRVGTVFGEHSVHLDSAFDSLTLTHRAKSRTGFAQGSLDAARWLAAQHQAGKRGVLTMDDFLNDVLS